MEFRSPRTQSEFSLMPASLQAQPAWVRAIVLGVLVVAVFYLFSGPGTASTASHASVLQTHGGPMMSYDFHEQFNDHIFVGHVSPDTDTIVSAIVAANLFDGVPARTGKLNSESAFVLEYFGVSEPKAIGDVIKSGKKVVLLDHNQESQKVAEVETSQIAGIIDHHAIQSGMVTTDVPIEVDIRPLASTCTLLAERALFAPRDVQMRLAPSDYGLMLAGILSDTLGLRSATTTDLERHIVPLLAERAKLTVSWEKFADEMFKAKSAALTKMSATDLLNMDSKEFEFGGKKLQFGVIETTDMDAMYARRAELSAEALKLRKERSQNFGFIAIVDIVNLESRILCASTDELELAQNAFKGVGKVDTSVAVEGKLAGMVTLENQVSRKKQFIPPISKVLSPGRRR